MKQLDFLEIVLKFVHYFFSGESVPVMKSALPMSDFDENDHQDNYDTERHKRHTLFSGELTNSYLILMSGSCHLDEASNVEIGVECQIFFNVIFFNCSQVSIWGTFKVL